MGEVGRAMGKGRGAPPEMDPDFRRGDEGGDAARDVGRVVGRAMFTPRGSGDRDDLRFAAGDLDHVADGLARQRVGERRDVGE